MPAPTLPGDEKQGQKYDVHQAEYDRRFNDIAQAEEKGTFDDIVNNYDKTSDESGSDIAARKESEGNDVGSWATNISPGGSGKTKLGKATVWFRKRGPLIGVGGGVGILAILFSSFIGPATLLPGLAQNSAAENDARGSILERRLVAAIDQKMNDTSGPCDVKLAMCRSNKIPKAMIVALDEKGISAVNADGSKYTVEGTGYVDEKPYGYEIDDGKGGKRTITSAEFTGEYKTNALFRSGVKKVYNMRYLGYSGKYMATNFFKKLGLNRDGGIAADPDVTESTIDEKLDEKLSTPSSASGEETAAKKAFRDRAKLLLTRSADRTKKSGGDPILMVGTGACMAIGLPRFAAGTYRVIQMAQLAVLLQDTVLSPGGMQQAGDAKGEGISALGNKLTERTKNSNGQLKSALDSSILLSAIGVNTNKVGVSKYAPGYSLLTNPVVKATSQISDDTKETCDLINSPQAAFAVAGIEGAISVGTAGVGAIVIGALKGIAKLAIVFGAIEAAVAAAEEAGIIDGIADVAYDVTKDAIGNYLEGAKGEELGDALGTGMYAYYSVAGTAGGAAVLKTDQVAGFQEVMAGVENDEKEEAIATLSPFDTSSKYTFAGNIAYSLAMMKYTSSNPLFAGMQFLGSAIQSPLSKKVSAQDAAESECSYASIFGVDEDTAVNPSGYGCVGIPKQYINNSRSDVMNRVLDDIDEFTGEPIQDRNDLTGKQNDIASMMNDCADGDLESLSGCTIDSTKPASTASYVVCEDYVEKIGCETVSGSAGSPDEQDRAALSLYMFDFQVENILAANDIESSEGGTIATGEYMLPVDPGYGQPGEGQDWGPRACNGCTTFHRGVDLTNYPGGSKGKPVYSVTSGEVILATKSNGSGTSCAGGIGSAPYSTNNAVHIQHADGTIGVYLHMAPGDITVNVGDTVTAGQQIGAINNCGQSFGAHLHFSIQLGSASDPKITSIEQNANGAIFLNPVEYMKLYGVDVMTGTYTDGR